MKYLQKNYVRWGGILLALGVVFLPNLAYAANNISASTEYNIVLGAEFLLKLLSWIWVVPAIIAGKLMTNSFVYGSFIHLDVYLRKMRTFMRMMANYVLGFLFLAYILKQFFKPGSQSELFDVIKKTVIAGILIQMSWFLFAALIDISTIATAAVAALPEQVMKVEFDKLSYQMYVPKRIDYKSFGPTEQDAENAGDNVKLLDDLSKITPDADTVSGPLLFLGAGILNLLEYHYIHVGAEDQNSAYIWNWRDLSFRSILKILVLISITVPLIVLMVVNAVRIFWIWLWIIFSPLIILDTVFNGMLFKNASFGDKLKIGSILGLVFQPVAVVGLLSLGLILVIGVKDALKGGEELKREKLAKINVHIQGDSSTTIGGGNMSEMTLDGEFFKDLGKEVGGGFGQLIMVLFTVFLLWALVKVGFSASQITKGIADGIYTFAEKSAKLIPIPLPGIGKISVAGAKKGYDVYKSKASEGIRNMYTSPAENIMKRLGFGDGGIGSTDTRHLADIVIENVRGTLDQAQAFWTEARTIASQYHTVRYSGEFKRAVDYRLNNGGLQYLGNQRFINQNIRTVADLEKTEYTKDREKVYKYIDGIMKGGFERIPRVAASRGQSTITSSGTNRGKKE